MVIDGQVRQSCSCLANEQLAKTGKNHIELTPMTKFPVVRDLFVDRQRMFDNLKKIKGWVPIDGTHDLGPGRPPPNGTYFRSLQPIVLRLNYNPTRKRGAELSVSEDVDGNCCSDFI